MSAPNDDGDRTMDDLRMIADMDGGPEPYESELFDCRTCGETYAEAPDGTPSHGFCSDECRVAFETRTASSLRFEREMVERGLDEAMLAEAQALWDEAETAVMLGGDLPDWFGESV